MFVFKKFLLLLFIALFAELFFTNSASAQTNEGTNCNKPPILTKGQVYNQSTSVGYVLTLTNQDNSSSCPATQTYLLSATKPSSSWTTSFRSSIVPNTNATILTSISVPRGTSRTFGILIVRPSNAANGTYNIKASALETGLTVVRGANIDLPYTVSGNENVPVNCNRNPILTRGTSYSGATSVGYVLTLKNDDSNSSICPATQTYQLSATKPSSSWTTQFRTSVVPNVNAQIITSITVPRASTKTFGIVVGRPSGAANGSYTITAKAAETGTPNKSSSVPIPYTVTGPTPTATPTGCTNGPLVLDVNPAQQNGKRGKTKDYTVKITNGDKGHNCKAIDVNLSALVTNNGNPTWTAPVLDKKTFKNLAAQGNVTTKLHITSPANAKIEPKTIQVTAKEVGGATKTFNVKYVVIADNPNTSPSPTASTHPTASPTNAPPSPSPTTPPTGSTVVNFKIGADGIGSTRRVPAGGNKNPLHKNRNLTVLIYKTANNSLAFSKTDNFSYNSTSEKFEGSVTLPSDFTTGTYNIYVSGPRFLVAQYPGSYTITKSQQTTLPVLDLITGDINQTDQSANNLNLQDYIVLLSCSIYGNNKGPCDENSNYKEWSDLDDDGIIDNHDYTLWLQEKTNQEGDIVPDDGNLTPTPTPPISGGGSNIVGAFSINQVTDVPVASSLGLTSSIHYGNLPAKNSNLTKKMNEVGMKQWDGSIASLMKKYECHKANIKSTNFCDGVKSSDTLSKADFLKTAEATIIKNKNNPTVIGYYVLDDWTKSDPGGAKVVLQEVKDLITKNDPGKPTMCGFSSGHMNDNGTDNWSNNYGNWVLNNYSPKGCSYVAVYIYSRNGQSQDINKYDWTMAKLLPKIKETLKTKGWTNKISPLIGIPQATGGEVANTSDKLPIPTQATVRKQTKAFCDQGAKGIMYFTWRSTLDRHYPYNDPKIAEGMKRGIADCKTIWNS